MDNASPPPDDSSQDDIPPSEAARRFRRLTDPSPPEDSTSEKSAPEQEEPVDEGATETVTTPFVQPDDPYKTQAWSPESIADQTPGRSSETSPQEVQPVRLDAEGMPLPRQAPQRDPGVTRVQPRVAYGEPPAEVPPPPPQALPKSRPARRDWRRSVLRGFRFMFIMGVIVAALVLIAVVLAGSWSIYQYYRIAATLPDVGELRDRAAQFESTFIYDRDGNPLYEINDPQAGRRTYVALDQISPYVVAATIATEDKEYWNNLGFDPVAIARALWQNYQEGEVVSGASTITQQLARALLLSPEERAQRTNERKLREIILAAQMRAEYEPDEILELYLNEIYYGNLAYGIEAAAQTYFGKRAAELNFAEAAFLAGLPQAPATYDVYQNPEVTFARQEVVVSLTVRAAESCTGFSGGIKINSAGQQVCVTPQQGVDAILSIQDPQQYLFQPPRIETTFPHWVNYVRLILEEEYGAQEIYRAGFRVYTTLNPELQRYAQEQVSAQVVSLAASNVTNGALVAIVPATGEIVAMVGSDNYDDLLDGQINMAIRPRQPGSSIKPFTYLRSFEMGWTPATIMWDVPSKFPDGANPPYEPRNYDGRFHGPLRVRDALANSFNVPAVKALQFVGIYDDPDTEEKEGLIAFLERFGVATLTSDQYGLALTLGGGEVTLLQWTGAYATLANQGQRVFPHAIARITDPNGEPVCQQPTSPEALPAPEDGGEALPSCQSLPDNWGQQVVSPEHAFLITSILSDDNARLLAFGPGNALETSLGAAVKTGTTNDIRDTWTMGYTPNLAVGVWVGNADFTPMAEGITSSGAAAPIWNRVIENGFGILGTPPGAFAPPGRVVLHEICEVTGAAANEYCFDMTNPRYPGRSGTRQEFFVADQPPLAREQDIVATIELDAFSGKLPGELCGSEALEEHTVVNIRDEYALDWLQNDPLGQQFAAALRVEFPVEVAPTEECGPDDPRPVVQIVYPPEDSAPVFDLVQIWGFADVANGEFESYRVDWGLGDDPQGWGFVTDAIPERHSDEESPALLAEFETRDKPNELVTVRLVVRDTQGHEAEARRRLQIDNPTPTWTPSNTPTPIPSDTATPTITPVPPTATTSATLSASFTATATSTFTATVFVPTSTPSATDSPTASPTVADSPTATATASASATLSASLTATATATTPAASESPTPTPTDTP